MGGQKFNSTSVKEIMKKRKKESKENIVYYFELLGSTRDYAMLFQKLRNVKTVTLPSSPVSMYFFSWLH